MDMLASPVQNARKEWCAVSEHHSPHFSSDGDLSRLKVGQSDERTVYEVQKAIENADVDFCSIKIEGDMQNDILQQRLNHVSRQREEVQQMEVELRAQVIVRAEIKEIHNRYETQMKEHANNTALLQEEINDRDQTIQQLERNIEEKDREVHALKLDNEAAWAKEGLLREQSKELAAFRERHNPEAERAQHTRQIHDLQEHIKEKERQFVELQEQLRVAQDTIVFKDKQLREAQAWMNQAQELDNLHSTTNQSLQLELRDRTEQYNLLWIGCQRQFAEMERIHFNAIQQLQLELAEAKERNGIHKEKLATSYSITNDPQFGHNNGVHVVSGSDELYGKSAEHSNGNEKNAPHFTAVGNSSQVEHNLGIPFIPSMLGPSPFLTPAQIAVHPFMIHQQGVPCPAPSHVRQNHGGHFQSVQTNFPVQQHYEMPVDSQIHRQHVDVHISQEIANGAVASSTYEESQGQELLANAYPVESEHSQQNVSSQFQDTLNLNDAENRNIRMEESNMHDSNDLVQKATSSLPETNIVFGALIPDAPVQPANSKEVAVASDGNSNGSVPHETVSATQTNVSSVVKTSDSLLLDEILLLACIARTIPASGKISISSTLPDRLAKMLIPLHWHDYKKVYGKLDDFVTGHSELFVIEGDFIRLKDGAQKMIAASAAAAKLAAAAAAPTSHSSLSSVAVTPMSQSYRLKRSPSSEADHNSPILGNHGRQSNGIHNVFGGESGTKNMSNSADHLDLNGSENVSMSTSTGANVIGLTNARIPYSYVGRQHGRAPGAAPKPQRYRVSTSKQVHDRHEY